MRYRDISYIRRAYPWVSMLTDYYYRSEVEGVEHLSDKACLVIATHNGGMATPDLYCLMVAFWRKFGLEAPSYGLGHRIVFQIPKFGEMCKRLGAIPASPENGATVLRHNFPLLICPGGDVDSLKPYTERHQIKFGGRRGFIKLALRERVPIVPVVSVGAHETMFVINDGQKTAKLLRFDKFLRLKSIPLALSFPGGLSIAGFGSLPLPSKITVKVLPPIRFTGAPEGADDPFYIEDCFERVRRQMQWALTDLAARRRLPLLG